MDDRDPDETLESLVADVFGGKPRRPNPDDTIMVPPEPAPEPRATVERVAVPPAPPEPRPAPRPRSAPVEPAPAPPAAAEVTAPPSATEAEPERQRRSLLQRLQVSPAVIVASIIAGATGAAADAWFEDIASFFSELTAESGDLTAPPEVDLMPVGVAPSRFSDEGQEVPAAAGSAASAAPDRAMDTGRGADHSATAAIVPAAAAEPAPETAATAPADRIRVITWDESAGGTVVTFWGNGAFLAERVVRFRIEGGRPRELVKLRGIDVPFPQSILELGTPEVSRIRTGFHPQDRVNELHLVLDLTGPDVGIEQVETGPDSLRVHLRRGGATAGPGARPGAGPGPSG